MVVFPTATPAPLLIKVLGEYVLGEYVGVSVGQSGRLSLLFRCLRLRICGNLC